MDHGSKTMISPRSSSTSVSAHLTIESRKAAPAVCLARLTAI
jgi:hypothetical protein